MDAISRDDAIARFARFLDEQLAEGKQGEKWIAVNFDRERRITSVKATAMPPRFKPLPPAAAEADLTAEPPGR